MNNPFLKRLIRDKKGDIVHSSTYARAQNAKGMGAASAQSFASRMAVDRNRVAVRRYRDSKVVNEGGNSTERAKSYDAAVDAARLAKRRKAYADKRAAPFNESRTAASLTKRSASSDVLCSGIPPARKNPGVSR